MDKNITFRQVLDEIYEQVNWAYLAKNYFGKSRSWLYHKFDGRNNGQVDEFSVEDKETLKCALLDIAQKLQVVADKI